MAVVADGAHARGEDGDAGRPGRFGLEIGEVPAGSDAGPMALTAKMRAIASASIWSSAFSGTVPSGARIPVATKAVAMPSGTP